MEIKLDKVLNGLIKDFRESPIELSKATGIPVTTIRNWLSGIKPSAKNLHFIVSLSEHFGVSVSELLFDQKENQNIAEVLFSTTFVDNGRKYKLIVERVNR